jgi:hypothetical protein
MQRNRFLRTIGVMILLFVLTTAMYAFTAANTVPDSNAGIGDGDVDGYEVSGISYTFASDPSTIASVEFTLDKEAGTVMARGNADGSWVACSNVEDNDWTCAIDTDTEELESLEVAAAD